MTIARRTADLLVYWVVLAAGALISVGGPGFGYRLSRLSGHVWFSVSRRRREIIQRNLDIAYGNRSTDDVRSQLGRRACQHAVATGVELMMRDSLVTTDNWQRFLDADDTTRWIASSDHPNGLVVISGHLGSWEMGQYFLGLLGTPITPVMRSLDNPYLDRHTVALRSRFGNDVIRKGGALRGMLRVLRRGGAVAIMPDQDAPESDRFYPFLGTPAATHAGFAEVAARLGSDVVASVCLRRGLGFHFEIVSERIELPVDLPRADQADFIMRRYLAFLERQIERSADQYMWMHRRWKSRPLGEPPLYA